ncbi:hypothetical protein [Mycobacterium branderi]|uniref:ESX-1 secretion-associated protein n=1 Tax=Mycobacterium branderi TaxID=43348 RepID=A0A7I7WD95_9MYCO|nr:hypothetical protein [Mycobacterium branderi]MCV7231614.1 hypothetical protein [Mycobacterium branderi]ORA40395.1 hypothetical protein BST20_07660 [Mycobacterium branderi]BBZ14902.1 hypothetical protein MBRA_50970 [Mycobacterium branderi]
MPTDSPTASPKDINEPTRPITGDYATLVAQFNSQATHLRDPGLARRAHDAAALAGQIAALIPAIRDDKRSAQPATSSTQDFTRVTTQFNENVAALAHACPDDSYRVRIG